ncbi:hypothetical protein [Psychromarinibacter sp. S121]|uniref:hypothetical protein n=1 Tax=Psychromarinibacter sp. S121 TaxID=3415127 RepID=UPI003C7E4599
MTDFLSSDAGRCAIIAKQFLEGALTLDATQRDIGPVLFRPTLALAGQGLELFLKACWHLNGKKPPTSGKAGHDVVGLWNDEVCKPAQDHVFSNANRVTAEVRASGTQSELPDQDGIQPLIVEYVFALGKLHGEYPYPLRYPSAEDKMAPRTPFLVKTLWGASDDLLKRPEDFMLTNHRGED